MPKLKPGTLLPTEAEDAAIARAVQNDADTKELNADWFQKARPASDVLGKDVVDTLERKRRGRPSGSNKTRTTINLDNDIIAWAKGDNPKGWQTRINAALRQLMEQS